MKSDILEDCDVNMSFTDPRGEAKFRHYAKHTDQYSPETIETHPYWWVVPVVCWGLAVVVLLAVRQ